MNQSGKAPSSHEAAPPPKAQAPADRLISNHDKGSTAAFAGQIHQQPAAKPSMDSASFPSDADISFGADDFLMGSDELALVDLIDDDEVKGSSENEPTLSWSLTPPKAPKPTTQSSIPSQTSQKSALSQPTSNSNSHHTSVSSISVTSKLRTGQVDNSKSSAQILVETLRPRSTTNITRKFTASPPASSLLSSPGSTSKILIANSQEAPSSRPTVQDTIDQRGALRDRKHTTRDVQGQERQGLLRSQSSPSAGNLAGHPTRNKRRLPGPAGNLPRLSAEEREQLFRSRGVPFSKDTHFPATESSSPNSSIKKKMKAVHQGPIDSMFATGAWEDMLRAYKLPDYKPSTLSRVKGSAPMIELSISDIESRPELHRSKISGLVVMIKEVSLSEIDAAVTLLDPSGEMRGTVHRTVLDQYKNNEIRVGTVLALKNGSSQDRLSQKKRKLTQEGSQDSLTATRGGQESQTSSASDTPVITGVRDGQPSLSPDWDGVHLPSARTAIASANKSSASLEMLNMTLLDGKSLKVEHKKVKSAPPSQNMDRHSSGIGAHNSIQSPPQRQEQTQEVQFQSLQPTIGGSSAITASDVSSTPIIALGAKTPDMSSANASSRSSKSILLSFAASPNLRKRSAPSTLTQRSNSSITSPPPPKEPSISQSSPSPLPPSTQRTHSFSDWPEEFGEDDLAGALGSDTSYGSINLHSPKQSMGRSNTGTSNSAPLLSPVSAPPQLVDKYRDNYDDLDNLLDGLDE
ncbi:hypothetical protein BGX21_001183, partial [Mortierella sp. AD011]